MRSMCFLLVGNFLLLMILGCSYSSMQSLGDDIEETLGHIITDTAMLSLAASAYYIHRGQWPDSVEDLQSYCIRKRDELLWPELDWDAYSETELKETPDGELQIIYHSRTKEAQVKTVLAVPQKGEFSEAHDRYEDKNK